MSFLRIPQKIHHGLILIADLAETYNSGLFLSLEEIAKKERVSQGFLEEIATPLRRTGLIAGRRGIKGGYRLVKDPTNLTIAEVVAAIDGPIAMTDCLAGEIGCPLDQVCSTKNVWSVLQRKLLETMQGMTIAEAIRGSIKI